MAEAGSHQHSTGSLVHVSQQILGGCRQGSPPDLCCQRRAPLQCQLVQGDVVVTEHQGCLQLLGPGIPALSRQPKQEVDGSSTKEEPPRRFHSLPCLCRCVLPAQHPQLGIIQRLQRERGDNGVTGAVGAAAGRAPLTWTPMESRLTPAALKPARRDVLVELGLASSVTSAAAGRWAAPATASSTAATVPGLARLGVPPPKKTEVTL